MILKTSDAAAYAITSVRYKYMYKLIIIKNCIIIKIID